MHMITVSFGSSACPLLFKTEEAAKKAWDMLMPSFQNIGQPQASTMESLRNGVPTITAHHALITDDFGRQVYLTGLNFAGAILEDLDVSKEGQIEQALHNARAQAQAQQRAQSDPKLTAGRQGPAILSPMGAGNGRMF